MLQVPQSLSRIKAFLEHEGYDVFYFTYPSSNERIEQNADSLYRFYEKISPEYGVVHFVGHSLGGVIICQLLSEYRIKDAGRIVLIASPVEGSRKAEFFGKYGIIRSLYGPAVTQLAAENFGKRFEKLNNEGLEIGMITALAGKLNDSPVVPGRDDGVVAVTETKAPFLKDNVTVHGQHTLVLFHTETARQVLSFLKSGHFLAKD